MSVRDLASLPIVPTGSAPPRRRKQAKPRAFKQIHVSSSSEDESFNELIENEKISIRNSSPASLESNASQSTNLLLPPAGQTPATQQLLGSQVDRRSHSENGEDNVIIMLPTSEEQLLEQESGMTTPCSPTETTASSETTSSSSIDEMQMSYTIGVTEGTPYPCTFCDKAFPRLSYLKRHEQIHSDQMPFRCDYCQRLFKHKRSRDRHVKLHTGDKRYRCCHCESAFSRSDHLKIHMKTHDHMKPFQCAICNRGYNTAAALTSHMQNHKRNNSISNNGNCNNSSNNVSGNSVNSVGNTNTGNNSNNGSINSSLSQQNSRGNTPTNKVSDALAISRTSPGMGNPLQEAQQLTCGFCGVKCTSLETHIRQAHLHHLLFAGLLQNSFCHPATALPNWQSLMPPPPLPALTPANDLLQLHSGLPNGSSSPPSPKKAKIQGKSSTPASPQHPSSATPQPALGPFLCNQCSPSPAFPDFESFRAHLKSHLLASQHVPTHQLMQCPYCREVISSDFESHILNCHMGTVSTQYGCECCNKVFSKPDELQKHLMDIHAHHLYQCSLCRDLFDSKVSIQVHFAVKHSNECKIYKCNICGEFLNNEHDFKIHVKLIHLQQTHLSQPQVAAAFPLFGSKAYFRCKFCPEEFHIEYLLERHLEVEHSNQHKIQRGSERNQSPVSQSQANSGKHVKTNKTLIKCELCSVNNLKSLSELESHLKSQHKCSLPANSGSLVVSKLTNKCNICDEMFASVALLAEHKLKKHCIFGASQCLHCHSKIISRDEYLKHFVEHNHLNDNGLSTALFPVACIVCKQTLMSEVEIDLHARYHCESDSERREKAASPSGKSDSEINNSAHSKSTIESLTNSNSVDSKVQAFESCNSPDNNSITSKRYQCIKCQESFTSEDEVKEHVHQHMINEGTIECKLCEKEFDTPAKLQSHLIEHNFNGGDQYKCHLCKTSFNSSHLLQGHMFDEHINDRPFSCGRCLQKFWFPTELDNHTMAEHSDDDDDDDNDENKNENEEVDVNCDKCSDDELENDKDSGENKKLEDKYKCGKQFPEERNLKQHLKTSHSKESLLDNQSQVNQKQYPCNVCGENFTRKENRQLHLDTIHCC